MRWIFIFGLLLAYFVVACGPVAHDGRGSWRCKEGKLKVLSTIGMIEDLVSEIGGGHVDSIALIHGELNPHSYELVKGDDEKFAGADLVFYNGLGLEHGLSLSQNLVGNPRAIAVSNQLVREEGELLLRVEGQYDPHIWMDISLWLRTIDPIVEALSEKDPEHEQEFRANGQRVRDEMEEADCLLVKRMHRVPQEFRYLVTSHDAFSYFTRHYLSEEGEGERWRARCSAPEGLAPDVQLSVKDIRKIVDHVALYGIGVIFPESNVNQDALKKVVLASKEKGRPLRLCREALYGDALMPNENYLEMIRYNIEVIAHEFEVDYERF